MSFARPHRVAPPDTAVPQRADTAVPQRADTAVPQRADTAVPQRVGPRLAESERRPSTSDRQLDGCSLIPATNGATHRVDSPHAADSNIGEPIDLTSQENWLRLHGTDLVDRLQTWASDLDAREAQLNARSSLQDHRERRFRLHQQDLVTELAEQQRSVERLRRELEAQARRIAFSSDSPSR